MRPIADQRERERIHLLLIEDARRGFEDIAAGRVQNADIAIARIQRRRAAKLIGAVDGLPADLSARKKTYLRAPGYSRKRPR